MDRRITILWIGILSFFGLLVLRLFYWQLIASERLSSYAREQYQTETTIDAPRGEILARDGSPLSITVDAYKLIVDKNVFDMNTYEFSARMAPILVSTDSAGIKIESDRITKVIDSTKSTWIAIKQKINRDKKQEIEKLNIPGVIFEPIQDRYYPEASSSAQVLGFVGKSDKGYDMGYFGLEGYYNIELTGNSGIVARQSNALGAPLFSGTRKNVLARPGVTLLTSIDKRFQQIIEKKLQEGIAKYGAKSGTVIAMNPITGEILAMASSPTYDPREYYKYSNEEFKNPAISDSFEPGSIMKPLIMAAGIDTNVISPQTQCDICFGSYKIDKYFIETWNKEYYPNSTMTDVLVHSDNVGMVFVGNKLGKDNLINYFGKYGFGTATSVDLQGEAVPPFRKPNEWNIVDLATATFGQGIAVTPIQMIRAMASIANGGYLIKPHVVNEIQTDSGKVNIENLDKKQILSSSTTKQVTEMMMAAVKSGEAKWAVPKGFLIAGKTGTAQIPVAGHYDPTKTIASFVGFAPANDPKFVMLVILREPQTSQWGSETAAPLWFNISREVFPYMGIRPEN